MRSLPQSNPIVETRDRARDYMQGVRSEAFDGYVKLLQTADKPLMKMALFFTPGSKKAMQDLRNIMQTDGDPAEKLKQFQGWMGTRAADTLVFSSDAFGSITKIFANLDRMPRAQAEFQRADEALSRALVG